LGADCCCRRLRKGRMDAAHNAAKIMDALVTLGRAQESAFAMLGLPPYLQQDAQDASKTLKAVAERLISRRIATKVRVEAAAMRASSAALENLHPSDWSSPHAIPVGNGDILPLLIQHSVTQTDWPVRDVSQYRVAATIAQLNLAWAAAVRVWQGQDCRFCLLGGGNGLKRKGTSADLKNTTTFVRLSGPSALELQLHGDSDVEEYFAAVQIPTTSFAALAAGCPRLERLCVRFSDALSIACLLDILAVCPSLVALDLVGSFVGQPGTFDDLISAITERPQLRIYLSACDGLWATAVARLPQGRLVSPDQQQQLVRVSCSRAQQISPPGSASIPRNPNACSICVPNPGMIPFRYGWPAWSWPYRKPATSRVRLG